MNRRLLLALAGFIGVAATIATTAVGAVGGRLRPFRSAVRPATGWASPRRAAPHRDDAKTVDH